ncbi:MAG TPA: hypothetical protein DIC53_06800, partial [Synergistaceae bacterium]|nr:hypothetical protein [Synergistaceae bacterium]
MNDKELSLLFHPSGRTGHGHPGETVGAVATRAGVPLAQPCGGAGVCGKCRVLPAAGANFLDEVTETERERLGPHLLAEGVRLACCARLEGSGEVTVMDDVAAANLQILGSIGTEPIGDWDGGRTGCGVAVDLGTTSVVCCLADLERGEILDVDSFLNPQVVFGDDVLSRIAYASSEREGLSRLRDVVTNALDRGIRAMAERSGRRTEDIGRIVVAGNTVMEHLLLGVSPKSIGRSPYRPTFLKYPPVPAADLGIHIHPDGLVHLIPNVAGYVGGDIVSGATALAMDESPSLRLLVDVGTNSEIVLGDRDSLLCCAAAAGPAFEGARIQCGMRAESGAIERVRLAPDGRGIEYETVRDAPPRGICGSGLVDAVALLLHQGIIDRSGRFTMTEGSGQRWFDPRFSKDDRGMVRFLLADHGDRPLFITQKDVREVQLAVGAIRVGAEVLLERRGVAMDDVDEILLAGAFGNYIHVENAMAIGLLPPFPPDRVRSVRNSSGLGACKALASE